VKSELRTHNEVSSNVTHLPYEGVPRLEAEVLIDIISYTFKN